MASLTEVSYKIRKSVVFIVFVLVTLLLIRVVLAIVSGVDSLLGNSGAISPERAYGQLPAIGINAIPFQHTTNLTYVLNTPNGGFPNEPILADVYEFSSTNISLLSLDNAQKIATEFGFGTNYQKNSADIYIWTNGNKNLTYNLQTSQFQIQSGNILGQIQADSTAVQNQGFVQNDILSSAYSIITKLPLSSDYDLQNPTLVYLNYGLSNQATLQQSLDTANAVRVIYHRSYKYLLLSATQKLSDDKLPLLSDNPLDGNISITLDIDQATMATGVLNMNFSSWPINNVKFSTYGLKSPQQAWQDIQDGKGYLVYLVKTGFSPFNPYQTLGVSKFQAENISLAYFDGAKEQTYLQVVYVIKGTAILADGSSADFYFYDPAVI